MDNLGSGKEETFFENMNDLGWTHLHCLVERENVDQIKELLAQGVDANAIDNFNRTPLSIAAAKGNLQIVQLLLEESANVNTGYPLHFSCEKGYSDIVTYLIQNGANVNSEMDKNYPLLLAASRGNLELAKILIDHGADVHVTDANKETALHWACDSGNEELISFLVDSGCKTDIKDRYGLTPLSICLIRKEDRPDLVKLLLKKGASVNKVDEQTNDDTYLHEAEHPDSVLALIEFGVNVNAQNEYNESALYSGSFYRHLSCAKILLQNNADPNICANGGWTPLHFAAAEGYLDYVEELLKWKADVNAASAENIIPLHLAAFNGHLEIVRRLLEKGSFVDIPVIDVPDINCSLPYFVKRGCISDGLTPIALAASSGYEEVCKLLVSYGAKSDGISALPQEIFEQREAPTWPCSKLVELVRSNNLDESIKAESIEETDSIGWTLLHHSVAKEFYDMTDALIKKGASVNSLDRYKRTPLSLAATRNNLRIVNLLLDNGADVNLGIPLFYAADKESLDCVQRLIVANCDINVKNEAGTPVLVDAASNSRTTIVKTLLEHKADPNSSNKWKENPLHYSCRFGDLEAVQILVHYGANIHAVDSCNETPLLNASLSSNADLIKFLLEHEADVRAKNDFATTPLHNAVYTNFESGAVELLKAGASVNVCNDEGETPLHLSTENAIIVKALIEYGADVNHRAPGGWTPLHESVYDGDLECVKELLQNKANVNAASAENVLPIYLAAIKGHTDVVKELLGSGSFVDPYIICLGVIRDDSGNLPLCERYHIITGNTPLIGAASKGHVSVVELLVTHGASLNFVNSKGNTALHEAVLSGSSAVVEFLVNLDVDFSVKNKNGEAATDLAKELSNDEIVALIGAKI